MKNVVTLDEIREVEMRSQKVFDLYLQKLGADIPHYFKEKEFNERKTCPACQSTQFTDQFEKMTFNYRTCDDCGTMFVSNRPSDEVLYKYHQEAESHQYYVDEYLSTLKTQQADRFLNPRVNWILDSILEYDSPKKAYLDLRSKYPLLLDKIRDENKFSGLFFSRPLFEMDRIPQEGFTEKEAFKSNIDRSLSVITAFDYLDSLFNPEEFIQQAHRILEDKGLLFLTTRCISGFDMQILWANSKSILPPHHITLFSIEGLVTYFETNGFAVRELSTPGQLDLDIVANALQIDSSLQIPQFIAYLIKSRDRNAHQSFKEFLQKHRLSSYTRIVVQKRMN